MIIVATIVAIPAIMPTNRKSSRCKVVNRFVSADESFAIRPLALRYIRSEVNTEWRANVQNCSVASLYDDTHARAIDAVSTLKSDVLGLQ